MLRATFSHLPLSMGGLYVRVVTSCWSIGVSYRDMSQLEMPDGGGTSLDIPPKEVLRVVTLLEEAVIP